MELKKRKGLTINVSYRLPKELIESIDKLAEETGVTKTSIICVAVNNFIKQQQKKA